MLFNPGGLTQGSVGTQVVGVYHSPPMRYQDSLAVSIHKARLRNGKEDCPSYVSKMFLVTPLLVLTRQGKPLCCHRQTSIEISTDVGRTGLHFFASI